MKTVDDLMNDLNEMQIKLKELDSALAELKKDSDECLKFDKKLIQALQQAESNTDTILLPSGVYHGIEIK